LVEEAPETFGTQLVAAETAGHPVGSKPLFVRAELVAKGSLPQALKAIKESPNRMPIDARSSLLKRRPISDLSEKACSGFIGKGYGSRF
jgi:hypothetical protein